MIPDEDSTREVAVIVEPAPAPPAPGPPAPTPPAPAAGQSWWATSWTGQRPTIGTIPAVRTSPSFTRSRLLPGLMVIAGAVVMAASTMPWLTANHVRHTSTVLGTDKAISTAFTVGGWASFAAGAVLVALGAVMMASDSRALRLLAALVATGTAAIAGYELIRVLQQIHYAHQAAARLYPSLAASLTGRAHVGYGLVMVCGAAGVAWLAGIIEAGAG